MRAALALASIVAAALLTGCTSSPPAAAPTPADNGVGALAAEEILARAQASLGKATTYRMKGEMSSGGTTATIDLHNGGHNVKGTIEIGGQALEVLRIGKDLYMKASAAFWQQFIPAKQRSVVGQLADRYVRVDATDASFSAMTEAFDPSEIVKADGALTKGTPTTVNGTPAIALVAAGDNSTIYVATVGPPNPLRITRDGHDVDFADFGEPVAFTTPASAEVLDLKSLMGG